MNDTWKEKWRRRSVCFHTTKYLIESFLIICWDITDVIDTSDNGTTYGAARVVGIGGHVNHSLSPIVMNEEPALLREFVA